MKALTLIPLLFILILSSFANAQSVDRPLPPQTVVGFFELANIWVVGYPDGTTNFDTHINFTFPQSPQDNGTFQYNLWQTDPFGSTLVISNPGAAPVPGRTGWLYYVHSVASTDNGSYEFRWTANNTFAVESNLSCTLSLNLRAPNGTLDQCGDSASTPPGINGFVTARTQPFQVGNITFAVAESANDTDANWTYVWEGARDVVTDRRFFGPDVTEREWFEFDPTMRNFNKTGTGVRNGTGQPTGLGLNQAYFRAYAFDNLTRWRSPNSCEIALDIGSFGSSAYCGDITNPETQFPTVDGGVTGPQFPLVNLTSLSEGLNASESLTAMALGFGIVGTGLVTGLLIGVIPGVLLGTLGLALAVMMQLLPPWWLVGVFMISIGSVIFRGNGGGSS